MTVASRSAPTASPGEENAAPSGAPFGMVVVFAFAAALAGERTGRDDAALEGPLAPMLARAGAALGGGAKADAILVAAALAAATALLACLARRRGAAGANAWAVAAMLPAATVAWLSAGTALVAGTAATLGAGVVAGTYGERRRLRLLLACLALASAAAALAPLWLLALPWVAWRARGPAPRPSVVHLLVPLLAAGLVLAGAALVGVPPGRTWRWAAAGLDHLAGAAGTVATLESLAGLSLLGLLSFGLLVFGDPRALLGPLLLAAPYLALAAIGGLPDALLLPLVVALVLVACEAAALVDLLPRAGRVLHLLAVAALCVQLLDALSGGRAPNPLFVRAAEREADAEPRVPPLGEAPAVDSPVEAEALAARGTRLLTRSAGGELRSSNPSARAPWAGIRAFVRARADGADARLAAHDGFDPTRCEGVPSVVFRPAPEAAVRLRRLHGTDDHG